MPSHTSDPVGTQLSCVPTSRGLTRPSLALASSPAPSSMAPASSGDPAAPLDPPIDAPAEVPPVAPPLAGEPPAPGPGGAPPVPCATLEPAAPVVCVVAPPAPPCDAPWSCPADASFGEQLAVLQRPAPVDGSNKSLPGFPPHAPRRHDSTTTARVRALIFTPGIATSLVTLSSRDNTRSPRCLNIPR